ncbi:MAG: gluconate 2-dehydrogenase subunit 3 family protein [Nitrospirae bacterium]|nr:gluconate 2-dehydrogenase subunit 3 family protein [Nitrospirota bacterium]
MKWMAASGAVVSLRGWSCAAPQSAGFRFTPEERDTLAALLDSLIPAGGSPGVVDLGGVEYIETLLNALGFDPPRIFAGGPFSGRSGGADLFSHFVPLSRAEELIWRTRIEGSKGIPEREFNGTVIGYQEAYVKGLAEAREVARSVFGKAVADLSQNTRLELVQSLSEEFAKVLYEHAVEAMYGDPVYGGNRDARGWEGIGFEGDRQPIGYSSKEVGEFDL